MRTLDDVISAIDSLQEQWNQLKDVQDDFNRRREQREKFNENINNISVKLINDMEEFIEELKINVLNTLIHSVMMNL